MTDMITLHLTPHPHLTYQDLNFRCAIGKGGITAKKREGDHMTPVGCYELLHVYYRPDKVQKPETSLPTTEITPHMGWCDDPAYTEYNKLISLPFRGSHEKLWRDDAVYDVIVEINHNQPPIPGKGSAVFIHIARENYEGTEGCIALKREDLLTLLQKNPKFINMMG